MDIYQPRSRPKSHNKKRWVIASTVLGLVFGVLIIKGMITDSRANFRIADYDIATAESTQPKKDQSTKNNAPHTIADREAEFSSLQWNTITISKGDSLSSIFRDQGFGHSQLQQILALPSAKEILTRLKPRSQMKLLVGPNKEIEQLRYFIKPTRSLVVSREGDHFTEKFQQIQPETRLSYVSSTITNSLFGAAEEAGLPQYITTKLATIFGWEINFAKDIHPGDHFSLLYEIHYLDGKKLKGSGDIVAAEFTTHGHTYRAVRFVAPNGFKDYYDPDGQSLRRNLLRRPLNYVRISDPFNPRRRHPILRIVRPHLGVDLTAPWGTPVKSTGDGRVIYASKKGGYGKLVVVKHNFKYSTRYAHLSRYARDIRTGAHVKQGQIIGYVGSTGLASGPHLHYEIRAHGIPRDPFKIALPKASPVPKQYHAYFVSQAHQVLAQLSLYQKAKLASKSFGQATTEGSTAPSAAEAQG